MWDFGACALRAIIIERSDKYAQVRSQRLVWKVVKCAIGMYFYALCGWNALVHTRLNEIHY